MVLSNFGKHITTISAVREIMSDIETTIAKESIDKYINFSPGNPDVIPDIVNMWRKYAQITLDSHEFESDVCRYSSTRGTHKLARAFISMLNRLYGLSLTTDNILIAPGSQQIYFYLMNLFTGQSGGIKKKTYFPIIPEYAGYSGIGPGKEYLIAKEPEIEILDEHSFRYKIRMQTMDVSDIGIVLLSRPSNPSGIAISNENLESIIDLCNMADIPLVVDSAYSNPLPGLVYKDIKPYFGKSIINVFSMSKCGIPGFRLGIAIGEKKYIDYLKSFQSNVCLQAATFGQLMLGNALESGELLTTGKTIIAEHYKEKIDYAHKCISKYFNDRIPYYIHKTEGTFFLWIWFKDLPITDRELYQILKREYVLVVPGSGFFPGIKAVSWRHQYECIRISLTVNKEKIKEGLKKIGMTVCKLYSDANS